MNTLLGRVCMWHILKCSVLINNIIVLKIASTVNCTYQMFKKIFDGDMSPNTLPNTLVLYVKCLLLWEYSRRNL